MKAHLARQARLGDRRGGMEAHGSPGAKIAQQVTGMLPDPVAEKLMEKAARALRA